MSRSMLTAPRLAGPVTLFELFNLGSPDSTDWMLDALCAETDPELFFPEPSHPSKDAKRVCVSCPVRTECLEDALDRGDNYHGVRGGKSPQERRLLSKQRRAVERGAVA